MENLKEKIQECLSDELGQMVISNKRKAGDIQKIVITAFEKQGQILFQAAEYTEKQVFHHNQDARETLNYIEDKLINDFKQLEITTKVRHITALVNKKGKATVKDKAEVCEKEFDHSHNRKKKYLLEEGTMVPFLVDLGVQTKEGKIVQKKYDKYRQINRFLEFIQDVLPHLPKDHPLTIIDFGCGKSYLTFAMYYYLHELCGYEVNMIGLDLKKDVIEYCNSLRDKYGYDHLNFLEGDIEHYHGVDQVDMVVTLHACDTATDYALYKAVRWGAKVILSVPCCQHEANKQIENDLLQPMLKYGLVKERFAALYTDALRGNLLEEQGYDVSLLEFVDMSHTPKNVLIRGIYTGKNRSTNVSVLGDALSTHLTLQKLLEDVHE